MYKFLECSYHDVQKYNRRILQSEGNHSVLKTAPFGGECCFTHVVQHDLNLVVPRETIREGVGFLSTHILLYLVYKWRQKWIINTCIIKLPKIHADVNFTLLFFLLYHHRTYLVRFLHWFSYSCCQHFIQLFVDLFFVFRIQPIGPVLDWICVRL